jgi:hypothetical protein
MSGVAAAHAHGSPGSNGRWANHEKMKVTIDLEPKRFKGVNAGAWSKIPLW